MLEVLVYSYSVFRMGNVCTTQRKFMATSVHKPMRIPVRHSSRSVISMLDHMHIAITIVCLQEDSSTGGTLNSNHNTITMVCLQSIQEDSSTGGTLNSNHNTITTVCLQSIQEDSSIGGTLNRAITILPWYVYEKFNKIPVVVVRCPPVLQGSTLNRAITILAIAMVC